MLKKSVAVLLSTALISVLLPANTLAADTLDINSEADLWGNIAHFNPDGSHTDDLVITITADILLSTNNNRLTVNSPGKILTIKSDGTPRAITRGSAYTGGGGAVYVDGGTFIMESGAKITGNEVPYN